MNFTETLREPEGKTLEFKRDLSSPERFLRTVVAFANTSGGTDQNAAIHLYTHERACPETRSARGRGVSNNARARQRPSD